ncbi:MAG: Leucine-rich repeat (LRR) protein [Bacteroidia bacterium]|jgi:Leucine-rich repeat (LRR) protein
MSHRLFLCLLCFPGLLWACQGYDFTVNDKVVYRAAPPFTAYTVPDAALAECLKQAILDQAVTSVGQLATLNCSHAGIVELDGLATFTGLLALRLSSNSVRNLVELTQLVSLEELYLEDNQVIDPIPLLQMSTLRHLDLSGNSALQCPPKESFKKLESLLLPKHCR